MESNKRSIGDTLKRAGEKYGDNDKLRKAIERKKLAVDSDQPINK